MESKDLSNQLLAYIEKTNSLHQERVDSLLKANQVIEGEYQEIEQEIELMKEGSNQMNHQIDTLVNNFAQIDEIERNVIATEENIDLIFKSITKMIKKVGELKKRRK